MTVCTQRDFEFPAWKRRAVQGSFTAGQVTSDGGVPLLRLVGRRLGLTRALARALPDARRQAGCENSLAS